MPIGQEAVVTSSASDCSISSNRSNGSRPSRSSLLTKVMIGTSRSRQTSKSLRVCSSMPPLRHWGGVEHHRGTVDRGQGAVGVLAEILVARRVEQSLVNGPATLLFCRGNEECATLCQLPYPRFTTQREPAIAFAASAAN